MFGTRNILVNDYTASKETVNKLLFKDDLRIDWKLIGNQQF